MKKLQNTKQGFSIVLAIWITVVISLIAILILEFIIPFSQNVKSVENWSASYYFAYSWIEDSLWDLSQNDIWYDNETIFNNTNTGSKFVLSSITTIVPPVWLWNSEYDSNWNKLDFNTPIQLQLNTDSINFNTATFEFRVPDINRDNILNDGNFSSSEEEEPVINWILSWLNNSWRPVVLNGKDEINNENYIRKEQINDWEINLWNLEWLTLDNVTCNVNNFYNNTCPSVGLWISSQAVIKLSIIDDLVLDWNIQIPYLEYRINFGENIPGRYSQIRSSWKSYGYQKNIEIQVPQVSTNQAFDFAVFQ